MQSLKRRIESLEQKGNGADITVLIQRFGNREPDEPAMRLYCGDLVFCRKRGESDELYLNRAEAEIREARSGLVVLCEDWPKNRSGRE